MQFTKAPSLAEEKVAVVVEANAAKVNEIVKLLILQETDGKATFGSDFDSTEAAQYDCRVSIYIETAKKILEVLN